MKYSRTAIGLLTAQYRSVLKKCLLINLGLYALGAVAATPANATDVSNWFDLETALETGTDATLTGNILLDSGTTQIAAASAGTYSLNLGNYKIDAQETPLSFNLIQATNGNLNISGGEFTNFKRTTEYGSVLHLTSNGDIIIDGTDFTNNTSITAAVLTVGTAADSITIKNSKFDNNTAGQIGAVGLYKMGNFDNVEFTNNKSTTVDAYGDGIGALFLGSVSATGIGKIEGSLFKNNTSAGRAGALGMRDFTQGNNADAKLDIKSTNFISNTAATNGGAIDNYFYNNAANEGYVKVTSSTFNSNSASNGGAVYNHIGHVGDKQKGSDTKQTAETDPSLIQTGNIYFEDSDFIGNTASELGGAAYNEGILTFVANTKNVAFSGNTANGKANDIYNLGTLNLNALAGKTISLEGGIDGDANNKGTTNIEGAGIVQIANALKNQNVKNTGNLVLDGANLDGTKIEGNGSVKVEGNSEVKKAELEDQTMEVEAGKELKLTDVKLTKTATGKGTVTNLAGGTLNIKGTAAGTSVISVKIDNYGRLISDPTTYTDTVNNYAGAYASFTNDTFTGSAAELANLGTVDLNTVTFDSGAKITGNGTTNLVSGTTAFNNTANSNTINLAGGTFTGTIANTGIVNAQNGVIDAITGVVTGGNLYVDASLGNTPSIDTFGAGTTGTIKKVNLLSSEYGTADSVELTGNFASDVTVDGFSYYTKVDKSQSDKIVFSDKLVNESTMKANAAKADFSTATDAYAANTIGKAIQGKLTGSALTTYTVAPGENTFYTAAAVNGLNVSTFSNDAGYITKSVSDLTNYYTKEQLATATVGVNVAAENVTGLKAVATSGSYNDLSDKPTLGTAAEANLVKLAGGDAAQVYTTAKADDLFATNAALTEGLAGKASIQDVADAGYTKVTFAETASGSGIIQFSNNATPTATTAQFYTKAKADDTFATKDVATTSVNGLMAAADKDKLDGIAAGAQVNVLEGVQLNGTDLTITGKKVNVQALTGITVNGSEVTPSAAGVVALGAAAGKGVATSVSESENLVTAAAVNTKFGDYTVKSANAGEFNNDDGVLSVNQVSADKLTDGTTNKVSAWNTAATKAGTAIQGVILGTEELTPDANKKVTISSISADLLTDGTTNKPSEWNTAVSDVATIKGNYAKLTDTTQTITTGAVKYASGWYTDTTGGKYSVRNESTQLVSSLLSDSYYLYSDGKNYFRATKDGMAVLSLDDQTNPAFEVFSSSGNVATKGEILLNKGGENQISLTGAKVKGYDTATALVNDGTKGNEALYTALGTKQGTLTASDGINIDTDNKISVALKDKGGLQFDDVTSGSKTISVKVDGTTLVNTEGTLGVGTIAQSQVNGLPAALNAKTTIAAKDGATNQYTIANSAVSQDFYNVTGTDNAISSAIATAGQAIMDQATAAWNHAEGWLNTALGIDSTTHDADAALQAALGATNYLGNATSFSAAIKTLDGQAKTNADGILANTNRFEDDATLGSKRTVAESIQARINNGTGTVTADTKVYSTAVTDELLATKAALNGNAAQNFAANTLTATTAVVTPKLAFNTATGEPFATDMSDIIAAASDTANQTLATEAYADTKISKGDIVADWSAVKDSAGTADTKVASEKLVYTSLHGTGTNDGTTVTPAGTVKLGDLAATTQVGTAENNLTVDHAHNQVTIKAGDTAVLTAKATGIEVVGDVKATTLTLPDAAGTGTVVANGIKNVVEANADGDTKNYLVTSAAVYAKTGDANFATGKYIETGDNLTQAAQHLDTKVFADIHGTGTPADPSDPISTVTPAGNVVVGDLAATTTLGAAKAQIALNNLAETATITAAKGLVFNGSQAVTSIDRAKDSANVTADEKILATKGTVKGAIEDLLKSNNVWTGTNEFQNTLTVTYDDSGTQKEILKAGLNGSVPEVTISGRLVLKDTLQFGTGDSVIKVDGIVDDIYDSSLTTPSTKLANVAGIVNALQGTGANGETIYFGTRAEKVKIGTTGYNMTIDTENGKTVISDGSTNGTITMDHGALTAGTSVTAGSTDTGGNLTSGAQMNLDGSIISSNGTKVATVKYDGITLSENGTAAGNVFTVDEHGSMTAGKNGANGQFVLNTQQGTADITTTKNGNTAGFGADGEVANIEASDGNYDYVVSADAKNKDVFVGLTDANSNNMLSGMQADDKGVGMGVGDASGKLEAGFSVEKIAATASDPATTVVAMGTFDNEDLNTGIVVDKTDQTVTLAASGQGVVEISYDATDGGLVDVTGTVSATKGFVVPGATDDVFSVDETGKTTTTTLAFTGDPDVVANAIDNGSTAQKLNADGSFKDGQTTTLATVATVLKDAENGIFTANNPAAASLGGAKTINQAINTLAENVDGISNVISMDEYNAWANSVKTNGYKGNITHHDVTDPKKSPTLISAIDDLDKAIGDRSAYNNTHYANATADKATVSDAIKNLDTAVYQDIHGKGTTTTPGGDVKIGDLANTTTVGSAVSNMTVDTSAADPANNTIKFNINSNKVLGIDKDGIDVTGNITATNDISAGHSVYVGDPAGQITAMYNTGIVSVKDGTHQATFGNGGAWVQNGDAQAGLSGTGMWAENGANKANVSNTGLWVETSATQNTSVGAGGMFTQNGNNNTGVGPDGVYTTDGTDHSSMGAAGFHTTKDVTADRNLSADKDANGNYGFTVTHDAGKDQTQVTVAGDVDTQSLTMADAKAGAPKATVTAIDTAKAVQDLDLSGTEPAFRDGQTTTLATVATVLNDAENAKYNPIAALKAGGTKYATAGSQTINGAIADIDKRIGDFAQLHDSDNLDNYGQGSTDVVVDLLNNIDSTLGTIHNLANARGDAYKGNLGAASDEGTTVEQHLVAFDDAIGDRRNYTAKYNIKNNQSVAESLDAMDLRMGDVASLGREMHYYSDPNPASVNLSSAVKSLDSNLYRLEMDHKKLRHETHAGLASAAALSALVPNPRGTGDTTLSFGTGAYQGHTAAAFGGFHWITNNLLVNAGVGWDNREATTRIGVSYSF